MSDKIEKDFNLGGSVDKALKGESELSVNAVLREAYSLTVKHFISFTPAIVTFIAVSFFAIVIALNVLGFDLASIASVASHPENLSYELIQAFFIAIFSAFIVSQLILVLLTRLREYRYAKRNQDASMQQALQQGQTALALRHSGYMIAMALSFNAASHFMLYTPTAYVSNIIGWLTFSLIMLVLMTCVITLVKKLVLAGIDLAKEVEHQHNIGVAAVEMAISIAVAFILMALMA